MSPLPFDPEKGNVLTRDERMAVLNDWANRRAAELAAEAAAALANEQPEVESSLDGIDVEAAAKAGPSAAVKLGNLFSDDWLVSIHTWVDVDGRPWARLEADIYDGVLHYQARYRLGRKAVIAHKPPAGKEGPSGPQTGWAPQWTRVTLWCWGEHIDPHTTTDKDMKAGIP